MAELIKEGFSDFTRQQREKLKTRREVMLLERKAADIKKRGGSANVEVIGGKAVLVEVRKPEIIPAGVERIGNQNFLVTVKSNAPITKSYSGLSQSDINQIRNMERNIQAQNQAQRLQDTKRIERLKTQQKIQSKIPLSVPALSFIVDKQEVPTYKFQQTGVVRKAEVGKLESLRRKIEGKQQKGEIDTFGETIISIGALAGIGAIRGTIEGLKVVVNPVKTAKGLVTLGNELRKNPALAREIATSEAQRFTIDPAGVLAEYLAFSKTLDFIGKAGKYSPVGRFVTEELWILKQPKELRPYVRKIIKSAKVQEKINPFKISEIKKVDFAEVKSLTRTEARALKKTLQTTDSIVFGSLAGRTLSKKGTPIPKDVDLATKDIALFNKKFIENLPKQARKNYYITPSKIYRQVKSKAAASDKFGVKLIKGKYYDPILDVKSIKRIIPQKNILTKKGRIPVADYVYKSKSGKLKQKLLGELTVPTQKIIKIEGIKLTGFGEQTTRKALGTLQVLLERNPKRAKDPQAFIRGLQVQIEALKIKPIKTKIARSLNSRKIKKLEDAVKVLTSKPFEKLLNKKVKGLTKEYPLIAKIPVKKLRKAKKYTKKELKLITKRLKTSKGSEKKKAKVESYLPKSKKPSRLPKSKIPSRKSSKLKTSRVPSKIKTSRIAARKPSKLKVSKNKRKISKIPSRTPSKFKISKVPTSKIPRSQIPKKPTSKIPKSKIPKRVPKRTKKVIQKSRSKKIIVRKIKKILEKVKSKYKPSLVAVVENLRGKRPSEITGVEIRRIIVKEIKSKMLKKAKIKRFKALSKKKQARTRPKRKKALKRRKRK